MSSRSLMTAAAAADTTAMRHPWRSTHARRRMLASVVAAPLTAQLLRSVPAAPAAGSDETVAQLAAIRSRLENAHGPASVSERRPDCPRADCSELNPCLSCQEAYAGRLHEAELAQQVARRHALADVGLLLPVVETLVAEGGTAALARLQQGLGGRRAL